MRDVCEFTSNSYVPASVVAANWSETILLSVQFESNLFPHWFVHVFFLVKYKTLFGLNGKMIEYKWTESLVIESFPKLCYFTIILKPYFFPPSFAKPVEKVYFCKRSRFVPEPRIFEEIFHKRETPIGAADYEPDHGELLRSGIVSPSQIKRRINPLRDILFQDNSH